MYLIREKKRIFVVDYLHYETEKTKRFLHGSMAKD